MEGPGPRWWHRDIDTTAADGLRQTLHWLEQRHIRFGISRLAPPVRDLLRRYEIDVSEDMIFASNREAVTVFDGLEASAPSSEPALRSA